MSADEPTATRPLSLHLTGTSIPSFIQSHQPCSYTQYFLGRPTRTRDPSHHLGEGEAASWPEYLRRRQHTVHRPPSWVRSSSSSNSITELEMAAEAAVLTLAGEAGQETVDTGTRISSKSRGLAGRRTIPDQLLIATKWSTACSQESSGIRQNHSSYSRKWCLLQKISNFNILLKDQPSGITLFE